MPQLLMLTTKSKIPHNYQYIDLWYNKSPKFVIASLVLLYFDTNTYIGYRNVASKVCELIEDQGMETMTRNDNKDQG